MKKAPSWAFLLHFELSFNIKLARFILSSEIKEQKLRICRLLASFSKNFDLD
ncbi:hypothetical protein [Photobacterium lucens]|uniref:hypothetical protein n=1 Tax=Photobacterium lucens TaxID=2562949 RepID=UPI000AB22013|nr:hypothetical protein [Photobacterium lucens]MBP2699120.1 hypothetical protein [Vibrio parahaemolyticus]